ncbi:UDP-glucose/GDP-mannose dehydrogenase family protein [Acetobacterium sp. K1/6]|jgi:UDPglucose 6-dehydrogenase|uniref:UDP-glucose dehydrogenase family protein n=1 Tax=Acetobacterium sp. K1/6 TaxID=3055467 RepID=UPI002ACA0A54|nr:UDP-glucose/GDP-mannose dehydrogenase family protein [Acetobacterium sp. K1/6]MDZ5724330.1 UDP-glucose/GDP-mannose dehydrogenase family protein [Acetobacterium sp. K1/6]
MNICIIGLGILGITYGSVLSDSDVNISCIDTDEETIDMLNEGELPVYEPGLKALVSTSVSTGRLCFSSNIRNAIKKSEIIFITCEVPTDDRDFPDLRFMKPIAQSIGSHMESYVTVVIKSTVPPGTCQIIQQTIKKALDDREVEIPFDVISNPDFARKGSMIKDCLVPDMVVIGSDSLEAVERLKRLYDTLHVREENYVITDPQSAEMIKYGVNAFLATKLSFINELALLCENANANIIDVSNGMGRDERIGPGFLEAGPGYGGSDLPKDSKALVEIARAYGEDFMVLKGAILANEKQKNKMVEKIKRVLGNLEGKTIGILGLSYKPETTDMREAPSINIIKGLVTGGAKIRIYCPEGSQEAKWRLHNEKDEITYCHDVYDAAEKADALVLITSWREFKGMDHERVLSVMKDRFFFDFRNLFGEDPPKGFVYSGLGIPEKEIK